MVATMTVNQDNAKKSEAARLLMEERAELEESDESSIDTDNDDRSSKFSSTRSVTSTEDRQLQEKRELEELIKNETKSVATWRETVTGILMIIAFIACVATFVFLGREEYIGFISTFQESAILLATKYTTDAEALSKNARVLSELLTANSQGTNSTWPFVTVPSFEVYGRHIRSTDGSDLVFMAPLVTDENRAKWEEYSTDHQDWISASMALSGEAPLGNNDGRDPIIPFIHNYDGPVPPGTGPYAPVWEISAPPKNTSVINLDLFKYRPLQDIFSKVNPSAKASVISRALDLSPLTGDPAYDRNNPRSLLIARVFDTLLEENAPRQVGMVALSVAWESIFENALPEDIQGIQIVVRNSCQEDMPFTYLLRGGNATFVGTGNDVIDTFYKDMEYIVVSPAFATEEAGGCTYSLHIYPTQEMRLGARKEDKIIFTLSVLGIFIVVWIVFWCYDRSVQKRNEKMLTTAAKSNLIVSSLFPSNFKKRLFEEEEGDSKDQKKSGGPMAAPNLSAVKNSKPLADFFPEVSVLFADICGFTAWSSVREPTQVFILLESIYSEFDAIAKRRRIFKIETIGDCYVCCAGLPEPRADHASALCRFANEAMNKMHEMVATLEETLGPDTGELSMRVGIHSGPVTAGVLRGERSRFQLFGDTVNTASRLESSSKRGRIHLSQATATILTNTGKASWVVPREDQVHAKGKGFMTTFWLVINKKGSESNSVSTSSLSEKFAIREKVKRPEIMPSNSKNIPPKTLRLVAWNVEILQRLLKLIVARRQASKSRSLFPSQSNLNEASFDKKLRDGKMVIHEVEEVITLPKYDADAAKAQENASTAEISETVIKQLREYITAIALRYKGNPFHNFEHASHVTMSVTKLLSRIVAPNASSIQTATTKLDDEQLHDHTYGITSDPLTQFSCIFSALIHDVEHTGVPNATLVKEEHPLSHKYEKVSVAEQNSVDVAWNLLMEPRFKDLRGVIYTNEAEMRHFRKLVVNCVMATDIVDKGLKELRNKRWERAFYWEGDKKEASPLSSSSSSSCENGTEQDVNRKATIVIEHLLQASDVSHTMQHWHVFRKWNENLFLEMYTAYRQGRAEKDPAEFWYKGETGFFDFYVIPLAKKLSQCGVFGVCSDEYLTYAESNRNEWREKGEDVVKELSKKALDYYENKHHGSESGNAVETGNVIGNSIINNNGIGADSGRSSVVGDEGSVMNAAFLNSVHASKENQRDLTAMMDKVDEESSFAGDDAGLHKTLIVSEVSFTNEVEV